MSAIFVGSLALLAVFVLLRPAPPLPDEPIQLPSAVPGAADSSSSATSSDDALPAPGRESSPSADPSRTEQRRRRHADDFPTTQAPSEERRPAATDEPDAGARRSPRSDGSTSRLRSSVVENVTVRDRGDRVVYRGAVDLGPTLQRIAADERLSFPDDGIVFQNRERRLPSRPRGYYHEYVLPTPKLPGPGPQRVVIGGDGEVYYTPDHYRTFQLLR